MDNRDVQELMVKGLTGMDAFDVGCIIKYLYRYSDKGGTMDLRKVKRYLEFLKERVVLIDEEEAAQFAYYNTISK